MSGKLRRLGMIGGMSWASTRSYYTRLNEEFQRRMGGGASAPLLMESLDFSTLRALQEEPDWARAEKTLSQSAKRLEDAGAGAIIICANSMHRIYDQIAASVDVPIIHIADCVGAVMGDDKVESAAVMGTRNVMTEAFYRQRLVAHGVDLLPPDMKNVEELDRIIYHELMQGVATPEAKRLMRTIITLKEKDGAQAIVLACTELCMVVDIDANVLPIYDSTRIHAEAAVDWLLGE